MHFRRAKVKAKAKEKEETVVSRGKAEARADRHGNRLPEGASFVRADTGPQSALIMP